MRNGDELAALVARFREGDWAAREAFFHRLIDLGKTHVARRWPGYQTADADDAVQQAVQDALHRLGGTAGPVRDYASWFRAIVDSRVRRSFARPCVVVSYFAEVAERPSPEPDPPQALQDAETLAPTRRRLIEERIIRLLGERTLSCRIALIDLYEDFCLPLDIAARILGQPDAVVAELRHGYDRVIAGNKDLRAHRRTRCNAVMGIVHAEEQRLLCEALGHGTTTCRLALLDLHRAAMPVALIALILQTTERTVATKRSQLRKVLSIDAELRALLGQREDDS